MFGSRLTSRAGVIPLKTDDPSFVQTTSLYIHTHTKTHTNTQHSASLCGLEVPIYWPLSGRNISLGIIGALGQCVLLVNCNLQKGISHSLCNTVCVLATFKLTCEGQGPNLENCA